MRKLKFFLAVLFLLIPYNLFAQEIIYYDWTHVGDAYDVTAMAAFNGDLYVTSNNGLWKRNEIGPGTGNDWTRVGDVNSVTGMAAFNGDLYVTSDNGLWRR